jgi:hypothetical protein
MAFNYNGPNANRAIDGALALIDANVRPETERTRMSLRGRAKQRANAGQPADTCLFVAGTAHVDAAQSVAADLARRAEREVEHPAASERAAVLHRTFDLLAVVEIGDDEDGAKSLGAMRAGDLVGLEALAARVPLVLPVDGGFLIVSRRPCDPSHPLFLEGVGPCG